MLVSAAAVRKRKRKRKRQRRRTTTRASKARRQPTMTRTTARTVLMTTPPIRAVVAAARASRWRLSEPFFFPFGFALVKKMEQLHLNLFSGKREREKEKSGPFHRSRAARILFHFFAFFPHFKRLASDLFSELERKTECIPRAQKRREGYCFLLIDLTDVGPID